MYERVRCRNQNFVETMKWDIAPIEAGRDNGSLMERLTKNVE